MNILLLNHYAGSMRYGMEFRPYSFAREWVEEGHTVTIVAASYSHLRQEQPAVTGIVTREEIDGIHYCWIKTPSYTGNAVMRAFNIFLFLLRVVLHRRRIVNGLPPHVVIGSSTYPLDNIVAHWIARHFNAKHVYEVHDLWPLSLTDLGRMSPRHPFVMLMGWAERFAYAKADAVVSLLPHAESHMVKHGLPPDKFFFVPNGVDLPDPFAAEPEVPEPHASILRTLRQRGLFIVGYTGGHAVSNALGSFVKAAMHLRSEPAAFVLVGSGAEKKNLMKLAAREELTNVFFLPPVPKAVMPSLLKTMDALFIGWQDKPIYRYGVSPNKMMDYMLSGKPIIHSNAVGNDMVAECQCGISVPPEDPQAIASAVSAMMRMQEEAREEMGGRGQSMIVSHYQNKHLARRFIECCARSGTETTRHHTLKEREAYAETQMG